MSLFPDLVPAAPAPAPCKCRHPDSALRPVWSFARDIIGMRCECGVALAIRECARAECPAYVVVRHERWFSKYCTRACRQLARDAARRAATRMRYADAWRACACGARYKLTGRGRPPARCADCARRQIAEDKRELYLARRVPRAETGVCPCGATFALARRGRPRKRCDNCRKGRTAR